MTALRVRRLTAAAVLAAAAAAAPVTAALAPAPLTQPVAGCPNGPSIPVGKQILGAYTSNCDLLVPPPPAPGAAPAPGAVIACRGLPGCLSYWVNYPGVINVPHRDTGIRTSP